MRSLFVCLILHEVKKMKNFMDELKKRYLETTNSNESIKISTAMKYYKIGEEMNNINKKENKEKK